MIASLKLSTEWNNLPCQRCDGNMAAPTVLQSLLNSLNSAMATWQPQQCCMGDAPWRQLRSRRRLSSPQAAAYRAKQVKGDAQQAAQPRDPAQPGRAIAHLLRESAPSPPRRGPAHCSRQAAAGEQTAVTKPPRDSVAQTSAPDAQARTVGRAKGRPGLLGC